MPFLLHAPANMHSVVTKAQPATARILIPTHPPEHFRIAEIRCPYARLRCKRHTSGKRASRIHHRRRLYTSCLVRYPTYGRVYHSGRRMRPMARRRNRLPRPPQMRRTVEIAGSVGTLFGTLDENLRSLESALHVTADLEENSLRLEGEAEHVERAAQILGEYNQLVREGKTFANGEVHSLLKLAVEEPGVPLKELLESAGRAKTKQSGKKVITPKSANQRRYMDEIEKHDMTFGVGPGGTGKTYLAVTMAVSALLNKRANS